MSTSRSKEFNKCFQCSFQPNQNLKFREIVIICSYSMTRTYIWIVAVRQLFIMPLLLQTYRQTAYLAIRYLSWTSWSMQRFAYIRPRMTENNYLLKSWRLRFIHVIVQRLKLLAVLVLGATTSLIVYESPWVGHWVHFKLNVTWGKTWLSSRLSCVREVWTIVSSTGKFF